MKQEFAPESHWETDLREYEEQHQGRDPKPKSELERRFDALPDGVKTYMEMTHKLRDTSLPMQERAELNKKQLDLQSHLRAEKPEDWAAFYSFINFRDSGGRVNIAPKQVITLFARGKI